MIGWLSILVTAGAAFGAAEPADGTAAPWDPEAIHLFATLPVQDGGRVKPLDTVAGFTLLKLNGRRATKNAAGDTIRPSEWLMDCLLRPEEAAQYKVFRVDNTEVLTAIGLPAEKKRARYAYEDLAPARGRLYELASKFRRIPPRSRTPVQAQLVNLAENVHEFETLADFLRFARHDFDAAGSEGLASLFPEQPAPRLGGILAKAPALRQMYLTLRDERPENDPDLATLARFLEDVSTMAGMARALALIPPPPGKTEWLTPADLAERAFAGHGVSAQQLEVLGLLDEMGRWANDPEQFKQALVGLHESTTAQASARGEYGRIELEVDYYRLRPLYFALILYVLSFVLIALSWLLPDKPVTRAMTFTTVAAPTLLLVAGIVMRCVIRGRPPVTTLYETILFATAVAVVTALVSDWIIRRNVGLPVASLVGALGLFLAYRYELKEGADTMPSMIAVLNTSFWLAMHVTTIAIGYGAGLLAGAMAHVFILWKALGGRNGRLGEDLTRMVYGVLCFALLFSMLGTVLGGIWANESWGRFWGWDPKENGALMLVLWQLFILHARLGGYIRQYGLHLAAIFGTVIIAFSWFGVNQLGVGLHSYGFTTGAHRALAMFYAVEGIVLLIGFASWLRDRKGAARETAASAK